MRTRFLPRVRSPLSAQGVIALGFAALILLTALLLMLPAASNSGAWTDPLTALFTAASAVCVTGLVVADTAAHWSLFGRAVLLAAIQTGGLGVMTVMVVSAVMLGRRIGLRQRTVLAESVASMTLGGVLRLTRRALLVTLTVELCGAALLAFRFVPMLGPVRGTGYAVFHAVSAFCSAGFDLMGTVSGPYTSMESFASDPLVMPVLSALILLGGLGFPVYDDLIERRFRFRRLSLHTRVVLALTPALVLVPAALLFFWESGASMAGMSPAQRLPASLFAAVTPRTAGFSAAPAERLSPAGRLTTMLLMLLGGNPGSTAGGAKTTTLLVFLLLALASLRRREDVTLFGRRLPGELLRRACSVVMLYLLLIFLAALAVCAAQPDLPLDHVLFEVVSALSTVGMSCGVTQRLNAFSRIVVILLMYAGRLGSLSFALLLVRRPASPPVRCPEGSILIG